MQVHYIENFVYSAIQVLQKQAHGKKTLIIGGDGRYFNDVAI